MDTTALEAEQLIQRWLDSVENARDDSCSRDKEDYLSALNWEDGEVSENARAVISGLMETKLLPTIKRTTHSDYDPRVAMEMRHRQVRERRRVRDDKRACKRHCDELAREVLNEAEEIVKTEEKRARAQAMKDELLIQQQMDVIRAQLKHEQQLIKHQREAEQQREKKIQASKTLIQAQQLIQSERKRLQTRVELLRQLEEAEIKEAKEDLRLVHQCFTRWWEASIKQRAKILKANTLWNWRSKVKVWHAWRRFVSVRKQRREKDQLARQLQRERRLFQVASEHHDYQLCSRVLHAWRDEVRKQRVERKLHKEQAQHKDKMEALLRTAAMKTNINDKSIDVNHNDGQEDNNVPIKKQAVETQEPVIHKSPLVKETVIWKQARQHLDVVLSSTNTSLPTNATSSPDDEHTHSQSTTAQPLSIHKRKPVTVKKTKSKPVTKPLPMSGMESRAAAMAQRKALREERKIQAEKERAERLRKEEEMKLAAEIEAKEALVAQKKEEKRIAKLRELERIARQKAIAELMNKADHHFQTNLLLRKGVWPWRRFVKQIQTDRQSADKLRSRMLLNGVFKQWKSATMIRLREKERQADIHHSRVVLEKIMVAWRQYVTYCKELEIKAIANQHVLLMKCVFRSWLKQARTEQMKELEMFVRARRFRDRTVVWQVFQAWKKYVPLSREEKQRENRRAKLRRKVATWLQDYQPVNHSEQSN